MNMCRVVTDDEVKNALFSISDDKAPGPDRFTTIFFKKTWHIIQEDFKTAIRFFFNTLTLPRNINSSYIAMVPKVENQECMNDFRPISCCNVIYKCIAKIIVSRIKPALTTIIGNEQTTFLPGRNISDAVLLSQELLHNYHSDRGPARCAIKIDIRKAFDTISWTYIVAGLGAVGIPALMISWIHKCISSAQFSVSLNGNCTPLMEKITTKIQLWTRSSLTYAGRLQLIKSVLFSYQVFWSTMFLLPCKVVKRIESMMTAFLWKGRHSNAGVKVAWEALCYPKEEEGLGLKRLKVWNKAVILKHIWSLASRRNSI